MRHTWCNTVVFIYITLTVSILGNLNRILPNQGENCNAVNKTITILLPVQINSAELAGPEQGYKTLI